VPRYRPHNDQASLAAALVAAVGCMQCSMKGHVKHKLQPWRLAKDSFLDSLPLLRRELPLSPNGSQFFCLRAPRARCGSFGESRLLQLQIPNAGTPTWNSVAASVRLA